VLGSQPGRREGGIASSWEGIEAEDAKEEPVEDPRKYILKI
jgi:hypothetical protein